MSNGIQMIADERARQVSAEGWTHEHDDTHVNGELAAAAVAYANPFQSLKAASLITGEHVRDVWPWEAEAFKRSDRMRDLVKAGALIAAEIDRLLRQRGALDET